MRPNRLCLVVFLAFSGLAARPAEAAMVFCNRTQNPIEAALGYRETVDWVTEGWWHIEPGQCARVFGNPLTQRFYFYYATSLTSSVPSKPPLIWSGKYELCTDAIAFRIEGDDNCETRHYRTQGFQEIDIGPNTHSYTLDFKDNSDGR
jgi:uncharacterized membrane protein